MMAVDVMLNMQGEAFYVGDHVIAGVRMRKQKESGMSCLVNTK